MCFAVKAPFSSHTFRRRHPRLRSAPEPACLAFAAIKLAISVKRNKRLTLVGIFFGKRKKGSGRDPLPQITLRPALYVLLASAGHRHPGEQAALPNLNKQGSTGMKISVHHCSPLTFASLLKIVRKESVFLASPDSVQHIRTVS